MTDSLRQLVNGLRWGNLSSSQRHTVLALLARIEALEKALGQYEDAYGLRSYGPNGVTYPARIQREGDAGE